MNFGMITLNRNLKHYKTMFTDSFIIHIKTEDLYKDIADVKNTYDISNYKFNGPLPKGMNKGVKGLMKDELEGKFITEFAALRPKTYCYLMCNKKKT